MMFDLD